MKAIITYLIIISAITIFITNFITEKDFAIVKQNQGLLENKIETIEKILNF